MIPRDEGYIQTGPFRDFGPGKTTAAALALLAKLKDPAIKSVAICDGDKTHLWKRFHTCQDCGTTEGVEEWAEPVLDPAIAEKIYSCRKCIIERLKEEEG